MTELFLRQSQKDILNYSKGFMGVSAVPGSGKTWTLSQLAAKLVRQGGLEPGQEVLVVTFSNSAADNFASRIGNMLRQEGLFAGMGYRVRTLHGLANDVIHERPDLAGLNNQFSIIDQVEAKQILVDLVNHWFQLNPDAFDYLLLESLSERNLEKIKRKELPDYIVTVVEAFIRTAKDLQCTPQHIKTLMGSAKSYSQMLELCQLIYTGYQSALDYRGAVDFDDLIRLAYHCLLNDDQLVDRLAYRWPFILEDEAQDSSQLQQAILQTIAGKTGNWVRVGDPNQAIYESFTTANPNLLKDFLSQPNVESKDLPESGRSSLAIINFANALNKWVQIEHPNTSVRDALSPPYIQPTPPDDPQPNPETRPDAVEIIKTHFNTEQELNYLTKSAKEWLKNEPDSTIAILSFFNGRVSEIAEALKERKIPVVDALMNLPETTRLSAGSIANILRCIIQPLKSQYLAKAYQVYHRKQREDGENWKHIEKLSETLAAVNKTEDFLYPTEENEWVSAIPFKDLSNEGIASLDHFREIIHKWHKALNLPADQLVLTIGQDLELDPFELATVHKLSLFFKDLQEDHPDWTIKELLLELQSIALNDRRFEKFNEQEDGFDPEAYKGQVVVCTTHKSKGLEWDKVFLTSVNNYDFPSGQDTDAYIGEKYFIKNQINLEAETLAQLHALVNGSSRPDVLMGDEAQNARNDVIRERLRLLFVGITRAKRSLTITWNTGKLKKSVMALPLQELSGKVTSE